MLNNSKTPSPNPDPQDEADKEPMAIMYEDGRPVEVPLRRAMRYIRKMSRPPYTPKNAPAHADAEIAESAATAAWPVNDTETADEPATAEFNDNTETVGDLFSNGPRESLEFEIPGVAEIKAGPTEATIREIVPMPPKGPGKPGRLIFVLRLACGAVFKQGFNHELAADSLLMRVLRKLAGDGVSKIDLKSLIGSRWNVSITEDAAGFFNARFDTRIS